MTVADCDYLGEDSARLHRIVLVVWITDRSGDPFAENPVARMVDEIGVFVASPPQPELVGRLIEEFEPTDRHIPGGFAAQTNEQTIGAVRGTSFHFLPYWPMEAIDADVDINNDDHLKLRRSGDVLRIQASWDEEARCWSTASDYERLIRAAVRHYNVLANELRGAVGQEPNLRAALDYALPSLPR